MKTLLKNSFWEISLYLFLSITCFCFYGDNIRMIWGRIGSYGFYQTLISNPWDVLTALLLLLLIHSINVLGIYKMFSMRMFWIIVFGSLFFFCGYVLQLSWIKSMIVVAFGYSLLSVVFRLSWKFWLFWYISVCLNAFLFFVLLLFMDAKWVFLYSVVLTWVVTIDFYFKED